MRIATTLTPTRGRRTLYAPGAAAFDKRGGFAVTAMQEAGDIARLRRRVNEAIAEAARSTSAVDLHPWRFRCECGRPECEHELVMTLDEFEAMRAREGWAVFAPHYDPACPAQVTLEHDGYVEVARGASTDRAGAG